MKKGIIITMRAIAVLLLLAAIAFALLNWVGTDTGYHISLYEAEGAEEATGLTAEGVHRAAKALTDCLASFSTESLDYEDQVYGQRQLVFNDREVAHMEDVAALFALLRLVAWMLAALGVLLIAAARFAGGRASGSWGRALIWGAIAFFALAALLAALILPDFDRAFIAFHHLFFTNDLWLLDPATDLMIRLLPQAFFERVVVRWVILSLIAPALSLAGGIILTRRKRT